MTFEQWVTKYEQKAEKYILLPGFSIYFEPDKGFFCWNVFRDVFEIDHTCTNDIKWAYGKCLEMAKQRNCILLRTATNRSPGSYMRLTKGIPNLSLSGVRANGKMYWIFEGRVI